jgi:flagellin
MRIESGQPFSLVAPQEKASKSLNKTNQELNKILERLSTALRINRASDDAAGLSVAEQLTTQIRGFKQASNNVSDAMSALNIADSAGNQVSDMVQRQRELALQSSNATLTDAQRGDLNTEYQALNQEITRISTASQFNTQSIAAGSGLSSGSAVIQAGPNAGDQVTMPRTDFTSAALAIGGTSIDTAANATNAINSLDNALNTLNSQRSTLGAMTNRFESTVNNLNIAEINTQAAESVLRDQDMASALVELTSKQILQQSTLSAFSKFSEISANHLFGLLKS